MIYSYFRCAFLFATACICNLLQPAGAIAQVEKFPAQLDLNHNEAMYGYAGDKLYVFGGKKLNGFPTTSITLDLKQPSVWVTNSTMPKARVSGWACEYNGKFYLVGGIEKFTFTPGQATGYTYIPELWEYDPATSAYSVKSPMPKPTWGAPAARIGAKIYVLGGYIMRPDSNQYGTRGTTVQIYDIAADSWTIAADTAPFAPDYSSVTVKGDAVYYLGNRNAQQPWGYKGTVSSGGLQWSALPDPPNRSFAFASGTADGKVYFGGGALDKSGGPPNNDIKVFDETANEWKQFARFPDDFFGLFVPVMPSDGTNLYFIGGTGNQSTYKIPTISTSVTENDTFASELSPNPAAEYLTVRLPDRGASCSISDITGRIVQQFSNLDVSGETRLYVGALPAGMYSLIISSGGKRCLRPFVKQ